jgi:DNA repair exonuclease SbcCD ATPase subunit
LELLSSAFTLGGTRDPRLKGCVMKKDFILICLMLITLFLFPFKVFGKEDRLLRIEQKIERLDQRLSNIEMRLTGLEANVEDIDKRFEELNRRLEFIQNLLIGMLAVFGGLCGVFVGLLLWDRKTFKDRAKEEALRELEDKYRISDWINALKEYSKFDERLAEILKHLKLL